MQPTRASLTTIRLLIAILLTALGSSALAGCTQTPRLPRQEVLIAGVRANSGAIAEQLVAAAIADITQDGDRVAVVSADGDPRVVYDVTLQGVPTNADDRADFLALLAGRVRQAVVAARAVTPQSDMLAALGLAARSFSSGSAVKRVDVLDSMVSTAGMYAMQHGGLYQDVADRLAAVRDRHELPDLAGVTVRTPLLGVVTAPQQQLDADAYGSLRAQWSALLHAAGARASLQPASTAAVAQPDRRLPAVALVGVDRPGPVSVAGCTQQLPDSVIGFEPDRAVFVDAPAAPRALLRLATALRGRAGTVRVDGYTSSAGTPAVDRRLSRQRAALVAGLLANALHLPAEGIRTTGWGAGGPCRIVDRDAQGRLLEAAAASNRKTVVTRFATGSASCG